MKQPSTKAGGFILRTRVRIRVARPVQFSVLKSSSPLGIRTMLQIIFYHFFGQFARRHASLASHPGIPTPTTFFQSRKNLEPLQTLFVIIPLTPRFHDEQWRGLLFYKSSFLRCRDASYHVFCKESINCVSIPCYFN